MFVRIAIPIVAKVIHVDHTRGEIRQMSLVTRWMVVMRIVLVLQVF